MAICAAEETWVNVMVVVVVMCVVDEEDMAELAMVKTHMYLPSGTEHLWQKLIYNLHTSGYSSPCNKIIISKK